jgi:hypothetical protein
MCRALEERGTRTGKTRLRSAKISAYDGEANDSYDALNRARERVERSPRMTRLRLASVMFLEGVSVRRPGENDR